MAENYVDCIALLLFMVTLQISQILFSLSEEHRNHFIIRCIIGEIFYFFCGILIYLSIGAGIFSPSHIGMYLVTFACSYIIIFFYFKMSQIEVIFVTTCGYALQHMGDSIFQIICHLVFQNNLLFQWEIILRILSQIVCMAVIYIFVINKNKFMGERKERDPRMIALSIIVLFAAVCLSVWSTPSADENSTVALFYGDVVCRFYAIICCVLVISLEFAVSRMNLINKQNEMMDQLIHVQGGQLQLSRESVSIINRKCHDIKYQMKALKLMSDDQLRNERVEELQKAISIYDSIYHTDNEIINFVLQEKAMLCEEYGIHLSCIADGKVFDFMASDDLYVLLGNAFDNAIESVMKETDSEKRIISIRIGSKKGMGFIHVENYCSQKIDFHDGLPVSTKKDKSNHGFGTQSIKYLTDKYQGNMIIQNKNEMYYLDLGFPLQ